MNLIDKSKDLKYDKNDMIDSIKARDIVKVIMDYGVNNNQIKKIIKFISLELEDLIIANKISNIIDGLEEPDTIKKEILNKPKLEL